MKKLIIIGFALMSAGAMAQSVDVTRIDEAYTNLRTFSALNLQVQAAQQTGRNVTSSSEEIDWVWDPSGTTNNSSKIAAFDYVGGQEVAHLVGDGTTLFSLNETRNAYIAHQYGTATATDTPDYRTDLLQHFDSLSTLRGGYASRFLQEVFGSAQAAYTPWSSGTMTTVEESDPAETDPITGRVYTPNASQDFVMYETSGTYSQSIVFQRNYVNVNGMNEWLIGEVYIAEKDSSNPAIPRTLQVVLTPTGLSDSPPATEFSFVPPAGSKPLQSTAG